LQAGGEAEMITHQRTIHVLSQAHQAAQAQIEQFTTYISTLETFLDQLKQLTPSPCPLCGGNFFDMATLTSFNDIEQITVFRQNGAYPLSEIVEFWGQCQKCEMCRADEPPGQVQYEWDRESWPARSTALAALVLSHYPQVERVVYSNIRHRAFYSFLIKGQWFTFDQLSKEEIAERLGLDTPATPRKGRRRTAI
jgi:hypothetical protein